MQVIPATEIVENSQAVSEQQGEVKAKVKILENKEHQEAMVRGAREETGE